MHPSWDPLESDALEAMKRIERIRQVLSPPVEPFEALCTISVPTNRKVLCAACLRRLDAWPDGRYTHKNGQIDMPGFVDHHEALPLKEAI